MEGLRALYAVLHYSFFMIVVSVCDCFNYLSILVQDIERPYTIIEEDPQFRRASTYIRVEKMFEQIEDRIPGPPDFPLCQFLLCILPERRNSEIYGSESPVQLFLRSLESFYGFIIGFMYS